MSAHTARRPTIAIESTALSFRPATGVSHYSREVFRRVFALRPDWDFVLTKLRSEPGVEEWTALPNVRSKRSVMSTRTYHRFFFRGIRFRYDWLTGSRPDLWVFPRFVRFPVSPSVPSVTFVYDLSFLVVPECADERNRKYLTDNVQTSVERSTSVVTISDYVTSELVELYGMDAGKAVRAYPAVDKDRFYVPSDTAVSATLAKHALAPGYLLSVGTLEPRKNVHRLVEAWSGLSPDLQAAHPLVLVGASGWLNDDLEMLLEPFVEAGSVRRLGYVDDADLVGLYAGAAAFAYLSRYEGFGMPVLEALACGAACVVASNTSLLEAGGPAVRYVDPGDLDDVRAALTDVLTNPQTRELLRRQAPSHVSAFDWDASAVAVVDEIERLLQTRQR